LVAVLHAASYLHSTLIGYNSFVHTYLSALFSEAVIFISYIISPPFPDQKSAHGRTVFSGVGKEAAQLLKKGNHILVSTPGFATRHNWPF
jgi:hypothetical protein